MRAIGNDTSVRVGAASVVLAGVTWAALSGLLYGNGHAPSVALLPIPRADYYLAQALFVLPLVLVLWLVTAWVAHRLGRLGGADAPLRAVLGPVGLAYGASLLVALLIPDLVAYGVGGFDAVTAAARFTGPALFLVALGLTGRAVRRSMGLGWGKAIGVAFAALLVQALLGAPLLR